VCDSVCANIDRGPHGVTDTALCAGVLYVG